VITPLHVKRIAEPKLRDILKDYPGVQREIIDNWKFSKWCELCASKINQLYIANYIRGQVGMIRTIQHLAIDYAERQLINSGRIKQDEALSVEV
jgi:hypothetical protein